MSNVSNVFTRNLSKQRWKLTTTVKHWSRLIVDHQRVDFLRMKTGLVIVSCLFYLVHRWSFSKVVSSITDRKLARIVPQSKFFSKPVETVSIQLWLNEL